MSLTRNIKLLTAWSLNSVQQSERSDADNLILNANTFLAGIPLADFRSFRHTQGEPDAAYVASINYINNSELTYPVEVSEGDYLRWQVAGFKVDLTTYMDVDTAYLAALMNSFAVGLDPETTSMYYASAEWQMTLTTGVVLYQKDFTP